MALPEEGLEQIQKFLSTLSLTTIVFIFDQLVMLLQRDNGSGTSEIVHAGKLSR
jgi:hypothetical protein